MNEHRVDEIGYWSEVKLDIVKKYAQAYSTILSGQNGLKHIYIDGFAGAGVHISRSTGDYIPGSPLNALNVNPPFKEFHFIDLDGQRTDRLRLMAGGRNDVFVYEGDCNDIILNQVLPKALYKDYRRALCLLDPYALNLNWSVIEAAGKMGSVEIFLNFMVMDMNMNVLWRNPDRVNEAQIKRMNYFWGDESWRQAAYRPRPTLFGTEDQKTSNEEVARAYQERLKRAAGFNFVPDPIPMRNSSGATVYYLFFASPNKTGAKIVGEIFKKYRNRGAT